MSFELPIINSNDVSIQELETLPEFDRIQELNRDRGLIDPIVRDPQNVSYNISTTIGYNNQDDLSSIVLENNYDTSEEIFQTRASALQFISRYSDLPESEQQQALKEFTNYDLNQNVANALKIEARNSGSNMFSEESQDFVKQIQESVKNYNAEKNLYFGTDKDRLQETLEQLRDENFIKNIEKEGILNATTEELLKAEKTQQTASQKLRKDLQSTPSPADVKIREQQQLVREARGETGPLGSIPPVIRGTSNIIRNVIVNPVIGGANALKSLIELPSRFINEDDRGL